MRMADRVNTVSGRFGQWIRREGSSKIRLCISNGFFHGLLREGSCKERDARVMRPQQARSGCVVWDVRVVAGELEGVSEGVRE